MPTLEWIGKSKVINHHQDVPFRVLERKYSFDENGQPNKLPRTEQMDSKYKNPDNDPRGAWRNIVASAPDSAAHQGYQPA